MKLKFICLNLWLGGKLFDGILNFLNQEKPDILAVQEAYDSKDKKIESRFRSIEILKPLFTDYYFSPTCLAILGKNKVEAGNAVFSNFPIINKKCTFFDIQYKEVNNYESANGDYSMTPRNIQHALIKTQDTELNIFNTQGIWGKDGEDTERRIKMSETIIKEIKNKQNILLAGDFNVAPHTTTIQNIEKHLENTFKNKIQTTFNTRQKTNPIFEKIIADYIFTSPNLKITDSDCPQVNISDHLPLICNVEI